ncbi:MAG TPA: OPT/YSL family transporter [Kofleriaceae bacterium]|nr:OPT/YSL family transporter [Kofleriaceae bacterium]
MFGKRAPVAEHGIAAVEAPGWWFPAGFLVLAPIVIVFMAWLFSIPAWAGVIAVVLAVLMGFVASRVTGETDITPTKALGPVTQMTFGVMTPGNLTGNIMSANVTGGIGLHAADLLTTLKTGWLLGAKPRHQLYAQLFGVIAGAVFIVPAFRILIPDPAVLGDTEWPAPSCLVWEGVSRAFANGLGSLDDSVKVAMAIGVVLGSVLAVVEKYAPKRIKPYVPSANGLGIAMVVPAANCVAMFLGALVAELLRRRKQDGLVIPVASGLIAGESILGIVYALLVVGGVIAK